MIYEGETEEESIARIRRVRARRALEIAPELAFHLRWDAVPIDGRTERGWLPEQRTPLLTGVTAAADALYVTLHLWVEEFATALKVARPHGYLWRREAGGALLGFRASTTPEEASSLVGSAAGWLKAHAAEIEELPDADVFLDTIADVVWRLRGAAGASSPRKQTEISTWSVRPCPNPACGEVTVRAEYFGEPMAAAVARGERLKPVAIGDESEEDAMNQFMASVLGVSVRCAACGWQPELRASRIVKWLA